MSTIPDSFAFAVSPDGRQFAIWEPGNEPWFTPEPAMNGRWITSADMDRLGWTRYTPQTTDGRAEVLREAAEVSAQWKSDCQSCAVELEVAGELRRLADEAAPPTDLTVYRASHDSIVMGLYITAAAARAHCETAERRSWPTGTSLAFDWVEDEEDGIAELVVVAGQNEESTTDYVVTALTVASKYDEEADE